MLNRELVRPLYLVFITLFPLRRLSKFDFLHIHIFPSVLHIYLYAVKFVHLQDFGKYLRILNHESVRPMNLLYHIKKT